MYGYYKSLCFHCPTYCHSMGVTELNYECPCFTYPAVFGFRFLQDLCLQIPFQPHLQLGLIRLSTVKTYFLSQQIGFEAEQAHQTLIQVHQTVLIFPVLLFVANPGDPSMKSKEAYVYFLMVYITLMYMSNIQCWKAMPPNWH